MHPERHVFEVNSNVKYDFVLLEINIPTSYMLKYLKNIKWIDDIYPTKTKMPALYSQVLL